VEQSGAFRIKIASKFFHLPNSLTFAFPKKQGDKYVSFSSLYTDPCQERNHARVAQLVEQLICNQQVAGSTPFSGSRPVVRIINPVYWQAMITIGQVVKWPTTTDCKSVLSGVRWFESILAHTAFEALERFKSKYERLEV
jgi:hypothetical protein